ncbi:TonB-dependent receptor [Sphingomonas crusticola]|uniref:TonB-dependent receptor n=1 Tax=Sphingomonas crusticola TaxID=1697973 RepID=UPI000E231438|nr:TonB-dependent receptor [Sphingomonas crusticola]
MDHRNAAEGGLGFTSCGFAIVMLLAAGTAPTADTARVPDQTEPSPSAEVVVTGRRGSAVTDIAPLATLDADTIAATGASSMAELLRAIRSVTTAADGSPPIYLLNGQRVSGYDEIGTLPPEALEKTEVLPEPAALKFGYPPTRRVVNFITKRRFRTIETSLSAGASTDGGAGNATVHGALTRLRNKSRLTLSTDYSHTDGLRASQRPIVADPEVPFDAIGNVGGIGGGEIDPLLTGLAGTVVTRAPVPGAVAQRSDLAAYAAGAGTLRPFEPGRLRSLTATNDTLKGNAILSGPISRSVAGTISLSAERSIERGLAGPARAVLTIPGGNPFSPFDRDVLLYRSLTEADPLRQHQVKTTLHAGGTLRGAIRGWQWDVTGAYDQQEANARNGRSVDLAAANAAIAAGANPFLPLDPSLLGARLIDRLHSLVTTANSKAVVTGSPLLLPAGKATLTASAEAERATADATTRGSDPYRASLGRNRAEGSLAIDLPITSKQAGILPFVGDLSINASANARAVTGYGTLHDTTYGASWSPLAGVQLLATAKQSQAAPDMAARSNPVTRGDNASILDYATGRTLIATIVSGGNPDLAPERRRVRSLALTIKPFAKSELRLSATFEATRVRDAVATVYALTPFTRATLPNLFVTDAKGQLTAVIFRPINIDRTWTKTLNLQLNASGQIGATPRPPKAGEANPKPVERAFYYSGIGAYLTLENRLRLMPGTPTLDIIEGGTITGGGSPHAVIYSWGGIGYRGLGAKFDAQWVGSSRVRGDAPAADLRFLAQPNLDVGIYIWPRMLIPHAPAWMQKLKFSLDVADALNSRQRVRDGNGRVPSRFQAALLTPVGRTLKFTIRKLF